MFGLYFSYISRTFVFVSAIYDLMNFFLVVLFVVNIVGLLFGLLLYFCSFVVVLLYCVCFMMMMSGIFRCATLYFIVAYVSWCLKLIFVYGGIRFVMFCIMNMFLGVVLNMIVGFVWLL